MFERASSDPGGVSSWEEGADLNWRARPKHSLDGGTGKADGLRRVVVGRGCRGVRQERPRYAFTFMLRNETLCARLMRLAAMRPDSMIVGSPLPG